MPPTQQPPGDDMTIGELGRRMDGVAGDLRELNGYLRSHIEKLPEHYVPRAELAQRDAAVDRRVTTVETEVAVIKRDQVSTLRQVVFAAGAALAGALPGLFALSVHH